MVLRKLTMLSVVATLVLGLWALPPATGKEASDVPYRTERETYSDECSIGYEPRWSINGDPAEYSMPSITYFCIINRDRYDLYQIVRDDKANTRIEVARVLYMEVLDRKPTIKRESAMNPFMDENLKWKDSAFLGRLYSADIVLGYTDGLFRPDEPITDEHLADLIDRTLDYINS